MRKVKLKIGDEVHSAMYPKSHWFIYKINDKLEIASVENKAGDVRAFFLDVLEKVK